MIFYKFRQHLVAISNDINPMFNIKKNIYNNKLRRLGRFWRKSPIDIEGMKFEAICPPVTAQFTNNMNSLKVQQKHSPMFIKIAITSMTTFTVL